MKSADDYITGAIALLPDTTVQTTSETSAMQETSTETTQTTETTTKMKVTATQGLNCYDII